MKGSLPPITGRHIAYWHICKRKLWLWHRGIWLEEVSSGLNSGQTQVALGTQLAESSYPRRAQAGREMMVELPGFRARIDWYEPQTGIVYETKLSDKLDHAHRWQLLFYMWLLEKKGLHVTSGILEYPKLRSREEVGLSAEIRQQLAETVESIHHLLQKSICPPLLNKPICKACAYYDFCYVGEPLPEPIDET